ncbi:NlpC/P60 family protein [Devosia sp. FJ2-5-3]|jgi:NlpC/P60 family putative phage cell wall peptidase|uniref:NlpC/P60 family protein n=1 Tax=Devosia sp. FJ2-5-3 TaxID=2976680 RepID=UPI0023D89A92|nr:NlpC/P60 family protein [Devosia sp. FJ2-5-3]WEJ57572.1 NlpC/P60 family protein [Devosia sp. FJ2-5-3]
MNADRVVAAAREWLGTPYRHRASTLGAGCDCLGLVRGVWRTLHGDEPNKMPAYRASPRDPENAGALRAAAEKFLVPAAGELAAGQVVLFRLAGLSEAKHCGIMVSGDRFIHAQEKLGVVEANLTEGWARRVSGRFWFPSSFSP